jgi:hypothetical protein
MIKKIIDRIIDILWIGFSLLFLLSITTKLEFISPMIRNISLLLTLSGFALIILRILKIKISERLNRIVFMPSLIVGGFIITMFDWRGAWKTQTIIYNHGHFKFKTIEFQMQDKGALGYNRRIVDVTNLAGFLRIVKPIDTATVGLPWIKVDKDINELKLKE